MISVYFLATLQRLIQGLPPWKPLSAVGPVKFRNRNCAWVVCLRTPTGTLIALIIVTLIL